MANADKVFGFKPVGRIDGSPNNGQTMLCYKAAGTTVTNDLFVGDPVVFSGSGDTSGIPGVSKATAGAGNPILGIITGVQVDGNHLDRATWIDGADAGYVMVCCDMDTIFEVQADESLTYEDIGENANFAVTQAGSRTTGKSGIELDATLASSLSTWQFKIWGFPQRPDNTLGEENVKVLVTINNSQLHQDNAGV